MRKQRAALAERWARRTERVRRTPPRAPRGNFVGVARTAASFSDAPPEARDTGIVAAQTSSGKGVASVCFGSKADMCAAKSHVRFTPESDIKCDVWNVHNI